MKIKETEAAIEAILFAMGGSVELPRIARAIGVDEKTTGRIIRNMMDRYQEENRGIQIIELENSFQMCTKKEYYQYLINIALHPQKPALSDVMLETLSIIAYKQPVTKAEIEKIRGVKCGRIQPGQGAGASGCPWTSDPARDHGRVSALLRRTGSGIPACP